MSNSPTQWIESDPQDTLSTHASFRVTGDALAPDRLSEILNIYPTTAYAKGGDASRTGLWLIATRSPFSTTLDDHLAFLIARLFRNIHANLELVAFVERWELKAELHLCWHGRTESRWPEPTAKLIRLSQFLSAPLVTDFDREGGQIPVIGAA